MQKMSDEPSYIKSAKTGVLKEKIREFYQLSSPCTLCGNSCMARRLEQERGKCSCGIEPLLVSAVPHFGEEPCITGTKGSGNIFFGSCSLKCVYCQNFQISVWSEELEKFRTGIPELAARMIDLQEKGCHNINLVSPAHFSAAWISALETAAKMGLRLPVVYNTSSYESEKVIRLLDGVVDIFLADLRYSDNKVAEIYSGIKNYADISRPAVKEMFRQKGEELILSDDGIIHRGLIIRLLILPNDLAGLEDTLTFLKDELSNQITISLMSQYYPANRALSYPLLSRKIHYGEHLRAIEMLEKYGFKKVYAQELESSDYYTPDFTDTEKPF
jgi:putative pyruvate formate lyase activating enzyme